MFLAYPNFGTTPIIGYTGIIVGLIIILLIAAFIGVLFQQFIRDTREINAASKKPLPDKSANESTDGSMMIDEEGIQERPIHHATD